MISVVVITAALLGGGYWLLQRVAVVEVDATATPVGVALIGTPTPAFQLAELAPPTASPTEFVQPTRTPVPPTKYTVVSGDTCGGIAKALGVPYSEFLRVNQLNDDSCSNLQIGDEVIVPAATPTPGPTETLAPDYTPPPPPQAAAGGTYVVKQGDSCSVIAAQFNLSIDDLIRINPDLNLNQQCLIQVGDTLNVKLRRFNRTVGVTVFTLSGGNAPGFLDGRSGGLKRCEGLDAAQVSFPTRFDQGCCDPGVLLGEAGGLGRQL